MNKIIISCVFVLIIHFFFRFVGGRTTDYVSHYFRQSTLVATYSPNIEHVPHPDNWVVPETVARYIVRPPLSVRQAGRPRQSRARSTVEDLDNTVQQRCSRFGIEGHKRRSCMATIPIGGHNLNFPTNEEGRRIYYCFIG